MCVILSALFHKLNISSVFFFSLSVRLNTISMSVACRDYDAEEHACVCGIVEYCSGFV